MRRAARPGPPAVAGALCAPALPGARRAGSPARGRRHMAAAAVEVNQI